MRKNAFLLLVLIAVSAMPALAQGNQLESILTKMDQTAATFKSAQADFVWDQYQRVVEETDTQKGKMYVRRQGNKVEMMADISSPNEQHVLYDGEKVRMYLPKAAQITEYSAGKNKADVESFLVLGFGGRGHDLQKSFNVKFAGNEQIDGVNAAKLELTPKTERGRGIFEMIILWIDPARGVSVQQKFIEPESGNYRFAKYTNIKLNEKVGDDVFKLKTSGKVTIVSPQG
jgi:outer membrane lipoprotein-sorting protein